MRLAVIPARGGSKRVPRKNVRMFAGQPMIAWPVRAALASGCFDHVVVSTDDPEIAELATQLGAIVPFVRPPELADDHTGLISVLRHAIRQMQCISDDLVCCLYATAAFVEPIDLRVGLEYLETHGCDFCVAVTPFRAPIDRAMKLTSGGRLTMLDPNRYQARSQDLEPRYHDAGQFCWGRASAWLSSDNVYQSRCVGVVVPGLRAHDIDTEEDWTHAEIIFEALRRASQ